MKSRKWRTHQDYCVAFELRGGKAYDEDDHELPQPVADILWRRNPTDGDVGDLVIAVAIEGWWTPQSWESPEEGGEERDVTDVSVVWYRGNRGRHAATDRLAFSEAVDVELAYVNEIDEMELEYEEEEEDEDMRRERRLGL